MSALKSQFVDPISVSNWAGRGPQQMNRYGLGAEKERLLSAAICDVERFGFWAAVRWWPWPSQAQKSDLWERRGGNGAQNNITHPS